MRSRWKSVENSAIVRSCGFCGHKYCIALSDECVKRFCKNMPDKMKAVIIDEYLESQKTKR